MNELDQAIEKTGGVGALAKAIGVPNQNSISMWRSRGRVPLPWLKLIRAQVLHTPKPTRRKPTQTAQEA